MTPKRPPPWYAPIAITRQGISVCLVIVCLFVATTTSFAQQDSGLDRITSVTFPGVPLNDFISYLGRVGGFNIQAAPEIINERVTINLSNLPIRSILDRLCDLYGWEWREMPDGTVIIRLPQPPEPPRVVEKRYRLQYVTDHASLQTLIQGLMSDVGKLTIIPNQNLMIAQDTLEAIARIDDFMRIYDVPTMFQAFEIPYADANEVARMIVERFPHLPSPPTVDARSGTIFVTASPEDMSEIATLISIFGQKISFRRIPLKFADEEQASFIISTAAELQILSNEGQALYDDRTRVIIAKDAPERLDELEDLVLQMDQPPLVAYIEAEIMTVDDSFTFTSGVEWDTQGVMSATGGLNTGASVRTIKDPATGQEFIVKDPGRMFGEREDLLLQLVGGQLTTTYFNAGKLLAKVRMMESNGEAETLSAPRIIVKHNEEANLTVGTEEPFGVRQVSTGDYYRGDDVVTSRYRRVGVNLDVLPRISPTGFIEMDCRVESSSLLERVDIGQGTTAPRVRTHEVVTTVLVKSGRTVVLGGLIQREQNKTITGVPYLKDVPVLGFFFRTTNDRGSRRGKLLLFMTPHILSIDQPYERFQVDDSDRRQYHKDRGVHSWDDQHPDYLDDYTHRHRERVGETFGTSGLEPTFPTTQDFEDPMHPTRDTEPDMLDPDAFRTRFGDRTQPMRPPGLDNVVDSIQLPPDTPIRVFLERLAQESMILINFSSDIEHEKFGVDVEYMTVQAILNEILPRQGLQWTLEPDGSLLIERAPYVPPPRDDPSAAQQVPDPSRLPGGDLDAPLAMDSLTGHITKVISDISNRLEGVTIVKDQTINETVDVDVAGLSIRQALDRLCSEKGWRWNQQGRIIRIERPQALPQDTDTTPPDNGIPEPVPAPDTAPAEVPDAGIDKPIDIELSNTELSDILNFLSRSSGGIPITAAPEIANTRVDIAVKSTPIRQVLANIATRHNWQVEQAFDGGLMIFPANQQQAPVPRDEPPTQDPPLPLEQPDPPVTEGNDSTQPPPDLTMVIPSISYQGDARGFFAVLQRYTELRIRIEPNLTGSVNISEANMTVKDILDLACQQSEWGYSVRAGELRIFAQE